MSLFTAKQVRGWVHEKGSMQGTLTLRFWKFLRSRLGLSPSPRKAILASLQVCADCTFTAFALCLIDTGPI